MHFVRNHFRYFSTPEIVHSVLKHMFCIFHTRKAYEMLQNIPKYHFLSNGVEWMYLLRNNFHNSGTLKIHTRNTSVASFTFRNVLKCFKTHPNIILGLMEQNRCIWCEIIFATSVPRNSAFTPETQVLHLLHSERFRNAPKHSQTSFLVQWSTTDAVCTKPFSQLEYPKIVHSVLKHKFCIFSHVEGLRNTAKYS
jgi:hypothetical protein